MINQILCRAVLLNDTIIIEIPAIRQQKLSN